MAASYASRGCNVSSNVHARALARQWCCMAGGARRSEAATGQTILLPACAPLHTRTRNEVPVYVSLQVDVAASSATHDTAAAHPAPTKRCPEIAPAHPRPGAAAAPVKPAQAQLPEPKPPELPPQPAAEPRPAPAPQSLAAETLTQPQADAATDPSRSLVDGMDAAESRIKVCCKLMHDSVRSVGAV